MPRWTALVLLGGAMNLAAAESDRAALIGGNAAFAVDLYRREAAAGAGNLFLSPYSVSAAMALVDAGARGDTAAEIEKAMRFPFGGDRLATAWRAVLADVNDSGGGAELVTANALWAANSIVLRPEYLEIARRRFGAKIESLDFARAPEPSRKLINAWVEDATRKKIRELVAPGMINAGSRVILTNAIYMKAAWSSPFQKTATNQSGVFHAPGGDTKVAMMAQRHGFRMFRGGGLQVLELPYKGELSMLIVLPDANDGLAAVESSLTAEELARWEGGLVAQVVDVQLPRFQIESSFRMAGTLTAMGMRTAFDPKAADFTGMAPATETIVLSEIVHKARVDVTEAGTEAAAATAVLIPASAALPPPVIERFAADHPFLFLIRRNDSRSILFVGRVMNP